VDAVAATNVTLTMGEIRQRSPILADLEKKGAISIAGAIYDLTTGKVNFLST
jgi:carbonic anhydrase